MSKTHKPILVAWTEISQLTNFNFIYYAEDMTYIQFETHPPMYQTPANVERVSKSINERFGIEVGEVTNDHDDNINQMSLKDNWSLAALQTFGIPVYNEA